MKSCTFIIAVLFSIVITGDVYPKENRGAAEIILESGSRGNIAFPHSRHQDVISDCKTCHTLFPQKSGSIQALIAQGSLEKKQAMTVCQSCHKDMASREEKTGPTRCSKCHDKSLTK